SRHLCKRKIGRMKQDIVDHREGGAVSARPGMIAAREVFEVELKHFDWRFIFCDEDCCKMVKGAFTGGKKVGRKDDTRRHIVDHLDCNSLVILFAPHKPFFQRSSSSMGERLPEQHIMITSPDFFSVSVRK